MTNDDWPHVKWGDITPLLPHAWGKIGTPMTLDADVSGDYPPDALFIIRTTTRGLGTMYHVVRYRGEDKTIAPYVGLLETATKAHSTSRQARGALSMYVYQEHQAWRDNLPDDYYDDPDAAHDRIDD